MAYRRIDVSGFELYFDLVERTKQFTPDQIKKFEKKGSIILGKHKDGRIAILDINNMINVAFPSSDPEPISSIEEFFMETEYEYEDEEPEESAESELREKSFDEIMNGDDEDDDEDGQRSG
jgi:hypothetical protein